jgi:hypothetical protein
VKPLAGKPGHEEVTVIYQGVPDVRGGEIGRELWLPHPLSEPEPPGIGAKAAANGLVQPLDLLNPVAAGKRREHRLVKTGQEQLDLAVTYQAAELIEIASIVSLEPFQQRPREVQHSGEKLPRGQVLQQWAIDVLDVLLEDVVEIANWLVKVESKGKADRLHG